MMQSVSTNWSPNYCFFTDASGSWGCGACWENSWTQCPWDVAWNEKSIAAKELLTILLAAAMWGPYWPGNQVLVQSDSMSVINVIVANTSKDKTIMHLLRGLHFICAFKNVIKLKSYHIVVPKMYQPMSFLVTNYRYPSQQGTNPNSGSIVVSSGPVLTRLAVTKLERITSYFIKDSITDSTRRSYSRGQSTYLAFCGRFNLQPLPVSEQQLILFTADLFNDCPMDQSDPISQPYVSYRATAWR